jgi:hypothetical protein
MAVLVPQRLYSWKLCESDELTAWTEHGWHTDAFKVTNNYLLMNDDEIWIRYRLLSI